MCGGIIPFWFQQTVLRVTTSRTMSANNLQFGSVMPAPFSLRPCDKCTHMNLSCKRQPQKLLVAKTQAPLYYMAFRIHGGNHRSCQSPRHTSALKLHGALHSRRQSQKLSVAKTQMLSYYIVFCIGRGNHRSCQSPRQKRSYIPWRFAFMEATKRAPKGPQASGSQTTPRTVFRRNFQN